ncbi:MAG: hypothetical protein R3A13_03425 [Bdellovibrionota bacterium]
MTEYEVTGKIKGSIPYVKNSSGRHLIGQQGCRGCTAASVEMLIMDHGGEQV